MALKVYLIGSLRNPRIPFIGRELRASGFDVFDDWHGSGPDADDRWREYEQRRGRPYLEALYGDQPKTTYALDLKHIHEADVVVMVAPAGRSGHLEFGYARGLGKPGYILLDSDPERWDVMYQFATAVTDTFTELDTLLHREEL